MDFSDAPRRPKSESIVPMINVVFLLLIFFLMTSQLTRPEPFDVTPPDARSEAEAQADPVLFLDKAGQLGFEDARGAEAIAALALVMDTDKHLQLRADAQVKANVVARVLRDLATAGFSRVELVVAPQ